MSPSRCFCLFTEGCRLNSAWGFVLRLLLLHHTWYNAQLFNSQAEFMPKLPSFPLFFSVLLLSTSAFADGPLIPAPPTIGAPAYLLMDATSGSVC